MIRFNASLKKAAMVPQPAIRLSRLQAGFTLIELMVGLLISIFIAAVAMTYMVSSSRMLTNQNSEDLIQESARFAFEIMSSTVRLASSNPTTNPNSTTEGISTSPQCTGGVDCNADGVGYDLDGTTINSDRIAVDYVTSNGATCTGDPINTETKLITVFFVEDLDGDGIPSLYCQAYRSQFDTIALDYVTYTAGNALPLIDGVDSLQVQYGVDSDGDNTIDRYSTYANVAAADIPNVRNIRIGLLISSGQSITTEQNTLDRSTRTYQLYESSISKTDGMLRRSFTTTVFIPNMTG